MSLIYLFHYFRRMCVFFPNFWRFTINITGNGGLSDCFTKIFAAIGSPYGPYGWHPVGSSMFDSVVSVVSVVAIPWSHEILKHHCVVASPEMSHLGSSHGFPMAFPWLSHGHPKGPAVLRETGGGYEQHQFWHILCGPRAGDHGDLILTTMNSWISIINDMISI